MRFELGGRRGGRRAEERKKVDGRQTKHTRKSKNIVLRETNNDTIIPPWLHCAVGVAFVAIVTVSVGGLHETCRLWRQLEGLVRGLPRDIVAFTVLAIWPWLPSSQHSAKLECAVGDYVGGDIWGQEDDHYRRPLRTGHVRFLLSTSNGGGAWSLSVVVVISFAIS